MHVVTKTLASGQKRLYAYAWRGGPQIARAGSESALEVELGKAEAIAKLAAAEEVRGKKTAPSVAYIAGLVIAYLKSPEHAGKEPRTRSDYAKHLNLFRDEFGDWRTALFEDPRIAQDLSAWRDSFNSARQGHMQMQTISVLFSWARSRGLTNANPTEAIGKVYSADRSDKIWTEEQIQAVLSAASDPLKWAIRLALDTGLRQADLIKLPWSAVNDMSIQVVTNKRKKQAIIPITPALRETLDMIPRRSPVILTNSHGKPWTSNGLRASFGKLKVKAGIESLRWNDFRGTAVTRWAKTALTLRDIARIIGWSETKVEAIMARYVSADALAIDMLKRIKGDAD
jgi:integrase